MRQSRAGNTFFQIPKSMQSYLHLTHAAAVERICYTDYLLQVSLLRGYTDNTSSGMEHALLKLQFQTSLFYSTQ